MNISSSPCNSYKCLPCTTVETMSALWTRHLLTPTPTASSRSQAPPWYSCYQESLSKMTFSKWIKPQEIILLRIPIKPFALRSLRNQVPVMSWISIFFGIFQCFINTLHLMIPGVIMYFNDTWGHYFKTQLTKSNTRNRKVNFHFFSVTF